MGNDQQRRDEPRQMSGNEVLSKGQRLAYVLGQLEQRRDELSAVLPPDQPFEAFHATINQALRANPDLLDATSTSLINACVKAGYDGLRVDGKEAIITVDNVKIKERGKPDRWEKQARYMPMYQGLVQQVLRGGLVKGCSARVVHKNDIFDYELGTGGYIRHKPPRSGDRGPMEAVYNIALLPSGQELFEIMFETDVLEVQKSSRSGWNATENKPTGVWLKHKGEMWKKTVLRRHRKTLPLGRPIHDSEALDEFPQFDRQQAHPQLAATPRPQRHAALADQSGTESGVAFDANTGEVERETVAAGESREEARDDRRQAADQPALDLPADGAEWDMWKGEVLGAIANAADNDALNVLYTKYSAALDAADDPIRDAVQEAFTNRAADIAAGKDQGGNQ
jgi:recombination protein RecT